MYEDPDVFMGKLRRSFEYGGPLGNSRTFGGRIGNTGIGLGSWETLSGAEIFHNHYRKSKTVMTVYGNA